MTDPSTLADHLGYWLRAVSNHVSHAFAAKVADRGVTVAEWVMLRALYGQPPTPPSTLAETMGVTRGAVTRLADRLIAKALIVRKASTKDGRAQTLVLTPKGARLVPELALLADRNDKDAFTALSHAERKTLEKLLRRIAADREITNPPLD